jgi:hypothetical protein
MLVPSQTHGQAANLPVFGFGEVRRFATGEALAAIGEVGVGLGIILNGQVDVPLSGYLVRIYGPTAAKH